jgi:tRNA1(Val) A37 N6-methylase TrmN6
VQKIFEQQSHPLRIIEVGAGVGMTGMQLATRFDAQVLLTDLPEAVPLLERNIQLNRERFHGGPGAV